MSETLFLVILIISELALIATGLAVYLYLRYRRMSNIVEEIKAPQTNGDTSFLIDPDIDIQDSIPTLENNIAPVEINKRSLAELSQAKKDLHAANTHIDNLEKDNAIQAQRIDVLEFEIETLKKTLQERNDLLQRLKKIKPRLNKAKPAQNALMREIKNLTGLTARKNQELSKLQSGQGDEFGDSAKRDTAFPSKAAGSK